MTTEATPVAADVECAEAETSASLLEAITDWESYTEIHGIDTRWGLDDAVGLVRRAAAFLRSGQR